MQFIDWVIVMGAAAIVVGVLLAWIRRKKRGDEGGCGCGCASCPHEKSCSGKEKQEK